MNYLNFTFNLHFIFDIFSISFFFLPLKIRLWLNKIHQMCESHSDKSHEMIFLARNHRKITLLDLAHYWVLNFAWISSFHECLMSVKTKCFISRNIFHLLREQHPTRTKFQYKLENYWDASLNFVQREENHASHWNIPESIFFSFAHVSRF